MAYHEKLTRGRVWCVTCGRTQRVYTPDCLSYGWPKCCGQTMTIDSPEERAAMKQPHPHGGPTMTGEQRALDVAIFFDEDGRCVVCGHEGEHAKTCELDFVLVSLTAAERRAQEAETRHEAAHRNWMTAERLAAEWSDKHAESEMDVTFWSMVADGTNHDPRCANHFAGDQQWGPCMRCQNEALREQVAVAKQEASDAVRMGAEGLARYRLRADKAEQQATAAAQQREALERALSFARERLRDFAENFDCDDDAHKYGTTCRACVAQTEVENIDAAVQDAATPPPPAEGC